MKFKRINFFNNKKIFREEYFSKKQLFTKGNKVKHFTLLPENIFCPLLYFWVTGCFLKYSVK